MMRPPLFLNQPLQEDENPARMFVPPKPSYVKSAASTVVKRPLAQHTPELTAMVSLCLIYLCACFHSSWFLF